MNSNKLVNKFEYSINYNKINFINNLFNKWRKGKRDFFYEASVRYYK